MNIRLVSLLVLSLVITSTTSIVKRKPKAELSKLNLHGQGNIYHLDLANYFDFSAAKMDTLQIQLGTESPGKIGSIKEQYNSVSLVQQLSAAPQQFLTIDKNTILVAEQGKSSITLIKCLSILDLNSCTFRQHQVAEEGFVFQDAQLHESNIFIVAVWLKLDKSKVHVELINMDSSSQKLYSKPFTAETNKENIGQFNNRVKLDFIYQDQSSGRATQIILFDQFIKNGKDVPIDKKVTFLSYENYIEEKQGAWGEIQSNQVPYTISDPKNFIDIDNIFTFYTHDNMIFVSSKRNDVKDPKLCLSKLEMIAMSKELLAGDLTKTVCGQATGSSYFGVSSKTWIYEVSEDGSKIYKYDLDWPQSEKYHTVKLVGAYTFKTAINGNQIRKVITGEKNFSIHSSTDQGINDAGANTLTVFSKFNQEFFSAENQIDTIVDNFNFKISQDKLSLTLIINPWYSLDGKLVQAGEIKDVEISVKDAENKNFVVLTTTAKRIEDPMSVIELNFNEHPNIHVSKDTTIQLGFEYRDIKSGNSLEFEGEVKKDDQNVEGFSFNVSPTLQHEIDIGMDISGKEPYLISFNSGSGIVVSNDRTESQYLTCNSENEFKTQCLVVGMNLNYDYIPERHIDTIGDSIVGFSNHKDTAEEKSYLTWFNTLDGQWQYEYYEGRIKDIGHIKVQDGSIWSVVLTQNKIQIAKFYNGWVYGSRKIHIFKEEDLNVSNICPVDVINSPYSKNDVYVYSDCPYDKRIFQFKIEDNLATFDSSFQIDTSKDLNTVDICINYGEISIFNRDKKELISLDYGFTTTKIITDLASYGITKPERLICIPEKNEFWILHKIINGDGEDEKNNDAKIAIFNGGKHKDALNRIKIDIRIGNGEITQIEYYFHLGRTVFLNYNKQNELKSKGSFDPVRPTFLCKVTYSTESTTIEDTQIPFSLVVQNKKTSQKLGSKFVFDAALKNPSDWLKGAKQTLKMNSSVTLSDRVKVEEAEVTTMYITDDQGNNIEGLKVEGTVDGEMAVDQAGNLPGKFLKLGRYQLIATYNKDNTMSHGQIKMYSPESGLQPSSFFTSQNSFKSVSALQYDEEYTLIAFLTDEGFNSELRYFVGFKGELSPHDVLIESNSNLKSVDMVFKEPAKVDGKLVNISVIIFGYDTVTKAVKVTEIQISLDKNMEVSSEKFMEVEQVIVHPQSEVFGGEFAIADSMDLLRTNLYYLERRVKRDNTFLTRNTFDKTTCKWSDPFPVTIEAKNEDEATSIFCQRFNNKVEDECVMATTGAQLYKAYIPINNPAGTSLKATNFMKLRITGHYSGTKVAMGGNLVVLAAKTRNIEDVSKLLIWDVTKAETVKETIHSNGVNQGVVSKIVPLKEVIDLYSKKIHGVDETNSSFMGVQFFETKPASKDNQSVEKDVFEIYCLQEVPQVSPRFFSLLITNKIVKPFTLTVGGSLTLEKFNSAQLVIEQPNGENQKMKLSDLYDFQASLENDFSFDEFEQLQL